MNTRNDTRADRLHILTLITFVPPRARSSSRFCRARAASCQWFTLARHAASPSPSRFICPFTSTTRSHGFQFEQNLPWIAAPAIRYHLGVDGLSHVARRAHRLPRPPRRARLLERHREAHQAVLLPLPAPADRDDRRLRRARPLPLLRLLGALARPDDPPHRHLRARTAAAGRHQVLPLHLHPLGALARRHPLALRQNRHLRLRRAAARLARTRCALRTPGPLVGLARLPRRLRRQGSRLPAARLARDAIQRSPHRLAMVLAGKLGLYSILRFSSASSPTSRATSPRS